MSSDPRPEPGPAPPRAGDDRKEQKRDEKRRRRELSLLSPWERYRALADAYQIAQDLVEFADRKVRFGLIVIGAINLVVFGAALRTETALIVPAAWRPWVLLLLAAYTVVLVDGVGHALSALRPRINPLKKRLADIRGLHFFDDILSRDLTDYERSWHDLNLRQLSSLMAEQTYALAQINRGKFQALNRMYGSIRTMLVMSAALLVLGVALVFLRADAARPAATVPATAGEATDSREYKLMLVPSRFSGTPGRERDTVRAAIMAFWRMVDAQHPPGAAVDLARLEGGLASGPRRRRLLQFFDTGSLPSDSCRPAEPAAFLFECRGLVVRSRVDVRPHAPGAPFVLDDAVPQPVELTVKSRSSSSVVGLPERRIQLVAAASTGLEVRTKLEKDMTVGRTTWGHSVSVRTTRDGAGRLFKATAPHGPGVPVPADLAELQALYAVPALRDVGNRPLIPIPGQVAYEETWVGEDALLLPGGFRATLTTSLWYDPAGTLKVVEGSWRLQRGASGGLPAEAVGGSEQLLDHVVAAAAREGWFDADALLKKAHALSGSGD